MPNGRDPPMPCPLVLCCVVYRLLLFLAAVCQRCDKITISPQLLAELQSSTEPLPRQLSPDMTNSPDAKVAPFSAELFTQLHGADQMAVDKLKQVQLSVLTHGVKPALGRQARQACLCVYVCTRWLLGGCQWCGKGRQAREQRNARSASKGANDLLSIKGVHVVGGRGSSHVAGCQPVTAAAVADIGH